MAVVHESLQFTAHFEGISHPIWPSGGLVKTSATVVSPILCGRLSQALS